MRGTRIRAATIGALATGLAFASAKGVAADGQSLAQTWCSACHQYPAPDLLDKDTWLQNVLPEMGALLGFSAFRGRPYPANRAAPPGTYPDAPLLNAGEWESIISYYEANAPQRLVPPTQPPSSSLELFALEAPEAAGPGIPTTTAVFIDEADSRIVIADGAEASLTVLSSDLRPLDSVFFPGPASRISRTPEGSYLVTSMGAIGREVAPEGTLSLVEQEPDNSDQFRRMPLVDGLLRPVDALVSNFNDDGANDYVVADFGRYSGSLTLHLGHSSGALDDVALLEEDGPLAVAQDGDTIIALIAQENERIVRFSVLSKEDLPKEEILLTFPPSQGSSGLSVLDFDGDGLTDLLYTAGDNADISPIFKPYHGIYLFLGQPDGGFREALFWHLDGAYGSVAEDFDGDGDMDIAAVAYFANYAAAPTTAGFLYLENAGNQFTPRHLEGLGTLGRWAVISAGDVDADGDADILLGNLAYGAVGPADVTPHLRDQWMDGPAFVLLRNQSR